jgi:D-inositol-3-phosphate glycosyltransferase
MNVVVRHQAEALAAAGHRVEILTRRSSLEQPASTQLAPGVVLRFVQAGPAEPVAKGTHEEFIDEFRDGIAGFGPFDVMHSHHWFSGMAALPLARATGIPHVQSFHSIAADDSTPLSEGERAESTGRMAGEAWLARESDAVIAISRAEATTVIERLGAEADRVYIVPPGVDGDLFHPATGNPAGVAGSAAPDSAAPNARGYAIVAARLQPLKGLDLAIDAIAAVPAAIRPDLVIAGDASSDYAGYTDDLVARATAHGIHDSVRFVGPQSRVKLAALLREAAVVLVPSHSETFGLVALEGAASGVPVIAAAAGGLREAIVNQNTGIVLDSRDPAVWADAIAEVVSSAELRERLSRAARERAEQFNWPHSADGLVTVYNSLVRPGAPDLLPELITA